MKINLIISFILLLSSDYALSQHSLDIEIKEISNNAGNIMLQLFNEKENVLTQEMSPIKNRSCSFKIENLKPGKYAVRYYHDENLNGKMESNLFGKPTEGYGFSNNVIGNTGPPPFELWLFDIKKDTLITLIPEY